ncbi:conserved unknown protein [Ectocarpus siliculosus]|uniref:Uncharacterized protein n=1 Tax=Ectocarpus siliculosus TaxID=2880 RepID=D8LCH5_ECTSI|nr:conserved unknown protein [Ectocarpus siliculosus]|eukprot:CBN78211.1 conserved unknown protein [Ectocarpus siliculosus]
MDYDAQPHLSGLARRGDMEGLQRAVDTGRRMDACNKFGESVVHVACRRGNLPLLLFLVANGGSLTACDDLGRFPLHERGCSPLRYVKEESWPAWRQFLDEVVDEFWPSLV